MKTKIIDNWEVELTNDGGDTLTLKGEWYADFFKEYENKQSIIADVKGLACKCGNQIFTHRHSNWIECTACNKIQVLQA